jgi:hypothetical protein
VVVGDVKNTMVFWPALMKKVASMAIVAGKANRPRMVGLRFAAEGREGEGRMAAVVLWLP